MQNNNDVNPFLPRNTNPQEVPSQALLDFLDAAETADLELHSLMVVQHGSVLAEGWWEPYGPDVPHMLYSLSKSFTSTAAGLAISENRFSLDDTVVSLFPDDLPDEVSDNLRKMRVRDLLSMATGHTKEPVLWETPPGSNWVRQFLAAPVEKEPGTHFLYNTSATYMVAALVEQTTGESLCDYLTPRLLAPLEIEGATWETDGRGIATGGYGLSVTTDAIAKFGQMYLQKGQWQGRQLVPEAWIAEATTKQVSNGNDAGNDWNQGYGFQFWCCRHGAYRGDGAFGQFCIVMPRQDAVVAITSGVGGMAALLNLVWEHLLPALENPPNSDAAAHQKLTQRLATLTIEAPQAGPASPPPVAGQVSEAEYRFEENDQNLTSVKLDLDGDNCVLTFVNADGKSHRVEGSLSDWKMGETTFLLSHIWPRKSPTPTVKTRVRGAWTNENTLAFKLCFYETPFTPTLTFRFDDGGQVMTLDIGGSVGFGSSERPSLIGRR